MDHPAQLVLITLPDFLVCGVQQLIKPAVAIKQRLRVVELDQADPAGQIVRQHRHFFAAAAQLVQLGFKFRLAFFYGLDIGEIKQNRDPAPIGQKAEALALPPQGCPILAHKPQRNLEFVAQLKRGLTLSLNSSDVVGHQDQIQLIAAVPIKFFIGKAKLGEQGRTDIKQRHVGFQVDPGHFRHHLRFRQSERPWMRGKKLRGEGQRDRKIKIQPDIDRLGLLLFYRCPQLDAGGLSFGIVQLKCSEQGV